MASLSLTTPSPMIATFTATTSLPSSSHLPSKEIHKKQVFVRKAIACKAREGRRSQDQSPLAKFDRRDVLVGLGGLYGAAGLTSNPFASAAPVSAPDLTKCSTPEDLPDGVTAYCCPPTKTEIKDFVAPTGTLRTRPPAHALDDEYVAKYKKAVELMRALPDDDPRSFKQQANVHCAYCNGAYDQVGFEDQYIQIHNCWLFFPFHRWYLYFYERILGKLIGDPTFALPFWNWDAPAGYQIPSFFVDKASSLYDQYRNQSHLPPALVDLDYTEEEVNTASTVTDTEQTDINLKVMYRQMVSNSKTPLLFFGDPYRAGDDPDPGAGSIENIPHNSIHIWCGDNRRDNGEDMGNFYSAGRDPLFYSHHCNVDRMWNLWKRLPGTKRTDLADADWLNTTFLFYDENAQLVRVKVQDCLNSRNLGYVYQEVDLPWLKSKPTPLSSSRTVSASSGFGIVGAARAAERTLTPLSDFPVTLDKALSAVVARPKTSRSSSEKEEEEEVLVIEGISFDKSGAVKFDVYVNDADETAPSGPGKTEFAGSFVSVPHASHTAKTMRTNLRLGITELLDDIGADNDETVVVTLVPKSGVGEVTVTGIKIELIS